MQRSRVIFNHKIKHLIVVNYKCGFSSINNAVNNIDGSNLSVTSPELLREWLDNNSVNNYKKILVKRNPVDRIISLYFDKLVNKEEYRVSNSEQAPKRNFVFKLLKEYIPLSEYEKFMNATKEDLCLNEYFYRFVRYLPIIMMRNGHTHPQYLIYTRAGLSLSFFDEIIETSEISTRLSEILGIDIPHKNHNKTPNLEKDRLVCQKSLNIIKVLYSQDFSELGYEVSI